MITLGLIAALSVIGTAILAVLAKVYKMGPFLIYTEPHEDLTMPPAPPISPATPSEPPNLAPQRVYAIAKANLGKHITLNPQVPDEVSCCEAVSFILKNAGYKDLPPMGIAGVNALIAWMESKGFKEVDSPAPGYIITAHQQNINNTDFAHAGICGEHWIISNTSSTGIFAANYTYPHWGTSFSTRGSVTRYFCPV